MKLPIYPSTQTDPLLQTQMEVAPSVDESAVAFVDSATRDEVARRRSDSEFVRRGRAAIARSVAAGDGIPAEVVIAKLELKVARARAMRAGISGD